MSLNRRASGYGSALDYELLDEVDNSTAVGLTIPAGAYSCLITPINNALRFRLDGGNPTPANGHYLSVNGNLEVFGGDMQNLRVISVTGTADVAVTYFGR